MVASYPWLKKPHVKPLFFKTPIFDGESITSWLIRAAFRQGCSTLTFTSYYWGDYRLWFLDLDKGFNSVDESIHEDMAVLAETSRERFDHHNLIYQMKFTTTSLAFRRGGAAPWVLPLSKRNRHVLYGYHYCPLCLATDKAPYLRLLWRYSWYTHCHIHAIRMENRCHSCNSLFQPPLLTPQLQTLDRCYTCHEKVYKDYMKNLLLVPEAYEFQNQSMQVLQSNQATVFGQVISGGDWFDFANFLITLTKRAAHGAERQYMMFRLLNELKIDTTQHSIFSLKDSETGHGFDMLTIHERIRFLRYAKMLMDIPLDAWINACIAVNASQNSFMFNGKKSVIPLGFMPVFNQLPSNSSQRGKAQGSDNPASLHAVKKSWARLQRKASAQAEYENSPVRK